MREIARVLEFSSSGDRPVQEDASIFDVSRKIFVVADGFGGPGAGDLAAHEACASVQAFLDKEAGDREATMPFVLRQHLSLAGNILFNALMHSNRRVFRLNRGKNPQRRGGASVVGGYLEGDTLALGSVGACGATLVRGSMKQRLVTPRTMQMLENPLLAPRPEVDIPLAAMGLIAELEPEIVECRVQSDDWLVLHTDGLVSEMIDEFVTKGVLEFTSLPPENACALAIQFK